MVARVPTETKIAEGNRSKLPEEKLQDDVAPEINQPDMPDFLSEYAAEEWRTLAPHLELNRLLTDLDKHQLAMLCQAWGRWRTAEEKIKEQGYFSEFISDKGFARDVISVHYEVAQKEMANIQKYIKEFGLSPASRVGLTIPKGGSEKNKNAWQEFQNRVNRKKAGTLRSVA